MKKLKVLCVNNNGYFMDIKKNQWYNVIETDNKNYYRMMFDSIPEFKYNVEKKDFLTIQEIRKLKLNKLNENNL